MKKAFLISFAALAMFGISSCSSVHHTSSTEDVNTEIVSLSKADLIVSPQKITYTYYPTAAVRRTGEKHVIETAISEALKANGNADVMVAAQHEIKKHTNFFGRTKIVYVTVEGYPATYANFAPVSR